MGCCQSHPNDNPSPTLHPTPSNPQHPINESPSRARTPGRRTNSQPPPPNFPSLIPTRSYPHRPLNPPTAAAAPPGETFTRPLLPPQPYRSKRPRTRRSLDREREEFFDTAITGRREIWDTLKAVTELLYAGELGTAQGILDAAGITLPDGDLVSGGAYDEVGNFYRLTREVVSDPDNLMEEAEDGGGRDGKEEATHRTDSADDEDREEDDDDDDADSIEKDIELSKKGKSILKPEDTITLKARLSDRGGPNADIVLKVGKKQTVKAITKQIQERVGLSGKGARIKLAYLGKILKEGESLDAQGYREGHVVNALVFPASS